jgi:hypothetical protein
VNRSAASGATRHTFAGLFLVTLCTLILQILLTRIFSVTMWYHFAFLTVSLAMFGITLGALVVYLAPHRFPPERTQHQMALATLLFGLTAVGAFLVHVFTPFDKHGETPFIAFIALTYVVLSVPFVCSGVTVCLALTRFPRQVSMLYAIDLAGAALGCVALIGLLRATDGPTAVFAVGGAACAGAWCFARAARSRGLTRATAGAALTLLGFATAHTALVWRQVPIVGLRWVKGERLEEPLYEKWNAHAYFVVYGDPEAPGAPFGWGFSERFVTRQVIRQLPVLIDAGAGTVITAYDGDLSPLAYLKYDVTNLAHYVRRGARVLVVGSGGGRDVLSSLVFGQPSVVAAEVNGDLLRALNGRFGRFSGHLDDDPRVEFVNDEARSWVTRQAQRFDIIQVSLIDTWAATAAGAYVLTENSLYTEEAWATFLEHLAPDGILSVSRWYVVDTPFEMYRLTALAAGSLRRIGVDDTRPHIAVLTNVAPGSERKRGVGNLLVSPSPFSATDLRALRAAARRLNLLVLVDPDSALDGNFAQLASGGDPAAGFSVDIAPPTDDRPFFFNMLRLSDVPDRNVLEKLPDDFNLQAVRILGGLLVLVLALTTLCVIGPLLLTSDRRKLRGTVPLFTFFTAIGFGFMLVEISQIQRLIVFLGHPTYGLSVLLFSLLLSSGVGSALTARVGDPRGSRAALTSIAGIVGVLVIFGLATPAAIEAWRGAATPVRILVAGGILVPLGLFMGMAFPLGMRFASDRSAAVTPWLWGLNGAAGVCASVLGVAIALGEGIAATFWVGVACYALAFAAFALEWRRT